MIGANGFIGSHIVDSLVAGGHSVTAFDRFSSGRELYTSPGVTQFIGDFLNESDLNDAIRGQEYVFHFLSTTTPATADNEPTLDVRTNITQSVELFRLCVEHDVSKVYFASTGGAIYGDQGRDTYGETDPVLPVSPYAIGKLTIEHYLRYFRAKHGLQSVSLRISNPYGPRQHPHRKQGLIPIALQSVQLSEPVVRFGAGSMVRDFIHVEDAAALITGLTGLDTEYDLYNIGSGAGHSVADVLSIIGEAVHRPLEIRELPTPPTFIGKVVLDTSRYTAEFGKPSLTSLREGILSTWASLN
ncbi:NAD-dependent epimerase/dehydratase family protein [Mycetocola zhujimingii]|uniref:NAD-dependent epimerase/dehydratase family protein n=1 Tax=Mycetocola zhujimingii TaxID=2079792 RepID=UPI0022B77FB1|nr:NAD-dependent epimerase/dehydratase family protein [Mycetocola zhujimingii]